jgi:hypothetical protein
MSYRPSLEEALESIAERVEYAARLATEAYQTPDNEDEKGKPVDPIHDYADHIVKDTVPLAVLGLFLLANKNTE